MNRTTIIPAVMLLECFFLSPDTAAQADSPAPAVVTVQDAAVDIIAPRSAEEISADMEALAARKTQLQKRIVGTQEQLAKCTAKIEVKEKEIELLESRVDAAEESKNTAEVARIEAEQQVAENLLTVYKAEKEVREAELEAGEGESAFLDATQSALTMETELARKRMEREKALGGGTLSTLGALVRELEGKTLQAKIAASEMREASAGRETAVMVRLRRLMEAQNTFLTGH
jgi:chromosome segregation ATPase